jgi:hypothetical protein
MPLMADAWISSCRDVVAIRRDHLEDADVIAARCAADRMTGSAEAAPPQQIRRKQGWRLDEVLNFEPASSKACRLAIGSPCERPTCPAISRFSR